MFWGGFWFRVCQAFAAWHRWRASRNRLAMVKHEFRASAIERNGRELAYEMIDRYSVAVKPLERKTND